MTRRHPHSPPEAAADPAAVTRKCIFNASASASAPTSSNAARTASFTWSGILTPDSQQDGYIKMADAMDALTRGCLRQITENPDSVTQPIVQCVQIKPMNSQQGAERYRVVMNDSINFMQGMLGQRVSTSTPQEPRALKLTVANRAQPCHPR